MRNLKKWMAIMVTLVLMLAGSVTALAGNKSGTFGGGSARLTVTRVTSSAKSDASSGTLGVVYVNMASYTSDGRWLDTKNGSAAGNVTVTYSGGGIGYAVSTHYAQDNFAGRCSLVAYS